MWLMRAFASGQGGGKDGRVLFAARASWLLEGCCRRDLRDNSGSTSALRHSCDRACLRVASCVPTGRLPSGCLPQSSRLPEAEAPSVPLVVQALGCNYRLGLRVLVACAYAAASLLHRIGMMEGDASELAKAARPKGDASELDQAARPKGDAPELAQAARLKPDTTEAPTSRRRLR